MRAFQIQDVKSFMSHLLLSNTFDRFLLTEASITTFNTFFIDGHLHKDYFSSDEAEMAELTPTGNSCGLLPSPLLKERRRPSP